MRNVIRIKEVIVEENLIECIMHFEGVVREAFKSDRFIYECSQTLTGVPVSIAVIPCLTNILPIAWVYDADIYVEQCDRDFCLSIPEFKKGYSVMYPMIDFKGKLIADALIENRKDLSGASVFFSGGVDSFDTIIRHSDENPLLLTVWGADIAL